jgi:ribosomal protein S19
MSKLYTIFAKSLKLKIYKRAYVISSELVGNRIEIHNGNKLISILIKEAMVGQRFGEFIATRKHGLRKNKMNKKNK